MTPYPFPDPVADAEQARAVTRFQKIKDTMTHEASAAVSAAGNLQQFRDGLSTDPSPEMLAHMASLKETRPAIAETAPPEPPGQTCPVCMDGPCSDPDCNVAVAGMVQGLVELETTAALKEVKEVTIELDAFIEETPESETIRHLRRTIEELDSEVIELRRQKTTYIEDNVKLQNGFEKVCRENDRIRERIRQYVSSLNSLQLELKP